MLIPISNWKHEIRIRLICVSSNIAPGLAKIMIFFSFFYLNKIYQETFCNGKSQLSTILTGFLIEEFLLINIRDKNTKKK